ncbi:MAG TPA: DUF4365 domain-containing protein [Planctomycetaceae bacterium]|nr:DUF4365 domain-containing protein [Planctomycetaceae bacterium]
MNLVTGRVHFEMAAQDLIGKRGESIVSARLLDFCGNPLPYFDPHNLGQKFPTFDYLVELVSAKGMKPYFFAQVRATKQGYTRGSMQLRVAVKAREIRTMVRCPIPTYVIGVDEPTETAYIVSIHGSMKGRLASIPTRYPLDCSNLKKLWGEVASYWESLDPRRRTSAFTF